MKHINAAFFLTFILFLFLAPNVLADNDLDHSGKMNLKMDRIGENQEKKMKPQDSKETELEKIAPDLFKQQNRDAIVSKQREEEKTIETLEQMLFASPSQSSLTAKDMEKGLFTEDYKAQYTDVANASSSQDNKEKSINNSLLVPLLTLVLFIFVSIYLVMRKMLR